MGSQLILPASVSSPLIVTALGNSSVARATVYGPFVNARLIIISAKNTSGIDKKYFRVLMDTGNPPNALIIEEYLHNDYQQTVSFILPANNFWRLMGEDAFTFSSRQFVLI